MTMTKSVHLLVLIVAQTLAGTKKIPHCSQTTTENTVCSVVDNYDNLSPPTSPTEIIPDIGFRGIHDIDEKKHTVTFLADLGMSWNEPRLSITNSSSDNKGYKIINHLIHSIWVPEMYFPNTIQMKHKMSFLGLIGAVLDLLQIGCLVNHLWLRFFNIPFACMSTMTCFINGKYGDDFCNPIEANPRFSFQGMSSISTHLELVGGSKYFNDHQKSMFL